MATLFQPLKIREVRRETPSTVSISLEIPAGLREEFGYRAGQYVTFRQQIAGEELRRSYSLCSSPAQDDFRVAVKEVPGGRFSTWANRELKAGETLETMTPMGNFTAAEQGGHHLAFAAGSGITPVISIIRHLLAQDAGNRFTLFYGNKRLEDIIFKAELDALEQQYAGRFKTIHMLSQAQEPGFGFGRLDRARLESSIQQGILDINGVVAAYLCGPSEMIFSLQQELERQGLASDKIRYELFTAPDSGASEGDSGTAPDSAASAAGLQVSIIQDGQQQDIAVSDPETTILDIGLAAGIDLPFACQGGVCCTCRAKVTAGEVDMRQNFSLGDSEVAEGYVLTCQSYPTKGQATIDFDS